ncbi:unnamed protein product [Toxocara canis]|uniref:DUF2252 domain-containing protein n=1 Tax=Toxocara canis TaxID=6265 RepID=A0A183TVZ8_TOXCA|nr:unnamed protein product [Toxocara canis]
MNDARLAELCHVYAEGKPLVLATAHTRGELSSSKTGEEWHIVENQLVLAERLEKNGWSNSVQRFFQKIGQTVDNSFCEPDVRKFFAREIIA